MIIKNVVFIKFLKAADKTKLSSYINGKIQKRRKNETQFDFVTFTIKTKINSFNRRFGNLHFSQVYVFILSIPNFNDYNIS